MRVRPDGKGGWTLPDEDSGDKVVRLQIEFPTDTGGPTPRMGAGDPTVTVAILRKNGTVDTGLDARLDWSSK